MQAGADDLQPAAAYLTDDDDDYVHTTSESDYMSLDSSIE